MFFVSIDYDEPDPKTYRRVVVKPLGAYKVKPFVIASGKPDVDYLATAMLCGGEFMTSSSVDHFVMDGAEWFDEENPSDELFAAASALGKSLYGDWKVWKVKIGA